MAFVKNQEDFVCEQCGHRVTGNGYTNHCSRCLWSKHVDVEPGDRAAACGGMMEPIRIEGTTDDYRIIHRCLKCTCERRNRVSVSDSEEALVQLAGSFHR